MKFTLVSSGLAALLLGLAHADQTDESKKAFTLRAHSPNQPVDQQVIAATDGGFYIGLAPNVSCNTNNFKCNQYGQTALLIRDYGECVVVDNGQALWDTNAVVGNTTDGEFSYGQSPATRGFVYVPDNYTNAHYTPGSFELDDSPGHAVGWSACPVKANVWKVYAAGSVQKQGCVSIDIETEDTAPCCYDYGQ